MKKSIGVVCLFTCFTFLFSCTKDNPATPKNNNPIVGLWIGTYHADNTNPANNYYYSYDLRADSSILVQGMGDDGNTYYGRGTWSLKQTAFNAKITTVNFSQAGVQQNITATYDSVAGKLTAGTVNSVEGSFSATFELDRIN